MPKGTGAALAIRPDLLSGPVIQILEPTRTSGLLSQLVSSGNRRPGEEPRGKETAEPLVREQPALSLRKLWKTYGADLHALRGIDLDVQHGEFVTLLGPSGSGKTTLLMVVAGFQTPTQGQVFAGASEITSEPPERRNFGVVFQSYALFPHMNVIRNVAYPLVVRGIRGKERQQLVDEALDLVGLQGMRDRRPAQLSGGQQQRVALARATVYRPSVLLLDEPLGALDRTLREQMQVELRRIHRAMGATFLYVTHDQDEALTMSDRVVVIRDGQIEQIGEPEQVYREPATRFVASFLGASNILEGTLLDVVGGIAQVGLDPSGIRIGVPASSHLFPGTEVGVLVRPENVQVGAAGDPGADAGAITLEGRMLAREFAGETWRCQVLTDLGTLAAHARERPDHAIGAPVVVSWKPDAMWLIPEGNERSSAERREDA